MSTSFATISPQYFELTPCRVTFGGVDLGGTDKVSVKIEQKLSAIKADQEGDADIDQKVSGMKITVETALDEVKLKANWAVVFSANKLVTQNGHQSFYFDSQVGASMRAAAKLLNIHPLSMPDDDLSADINIYLATANPSSQLDFSSSEQQKLKVTFMAYPDFTTQPARWMIYGDPGVGIVDATGGPAVAATGNVGNGTVSNITVNNGDTETEIVSLLCLTPGASANFSVNGSMSGPLGIATNGLAFVAPGNQIGFTVNDGGTHFALNDSFTIPTVAANYV